MLKFSPKIRLGMLINVLLIKKTSSQYTYLRLKARSHLGVAELSTAKITIKLQHLPPSYSVAMLHNALIALSVNEP